MLLVLFMYSTKETNKSTRQSQKYPDSRVIGYTGVQSGPQDCG